MGVRFSTISFHGKAFNVTFSIIETKQEDIPKFSPVRSVVSKATVHTDTRTIGTEQEDMEEDSDSENSEEYDEKMKNVASNLERRSLKQLQAKYQVKMVGLGLRHSLEKFRATPRKENFSWELLVFFFEEFETEDYTGKETKKGNQLVTEMHQKVGTFES